LALEEGKTVGAVYLAAVLDLSSRFVIGWALTAVNGSLRGARSAPHPRGLPDDAGGTVFLLAAAASRAPRTLRVLTFATEMSSRSSSSLKWTQHSTLWYAVRASGLRLRACSRRRSI